MKAFATTAQRKKYVFLLLLLTVGMLGLRLWHLKADFPSGSIWIQDSAKYTDEGWYTNAALNHIIFGHWYLPGDWSPAVAMPVWPWMIGVLFHFTGISIVAARVLEVVCSWLSVLMAYLVVRQYRSAYLGVIVAFLIACNTLGFFFNRLAILEAPVVLFMLLAVYVAGYVKRDSYFLAFLVGIAFCVLTLTKATGPFLLPAVLYPIWAKNRKNPSAAWRLLAIAFTTAIVILQIEKHFVLQNHLADYGAFFGPIHPGCLIAHAFPKFVRFLLRATWIDPVLYPIALLAFFMALFRFRFLWKDTLFVTAFLWEIGYAAFIIFHLDGPPRYFVVLIVPTVVLALLFTEAVLKQSRAAGMVLSALILASVAWNIGYTVHFMLRPQYTLLNASYGVRREIRSHPNWSPLLMGHGADQISLMAGGMPTVDTDGAMSFKEKLKTYHPGWYMFWGEDQPGRVEVLNSEDTIVTVTRFPALDFPGKQTLVLYQIAPRPIALPVKEDLSRVDAGVCNY
ncbi:MAG TPA: glycosyltransferase family 39 protein [Acidobacteriaceae bacterium]|nr:glycosyltransferase family 39 protein [Acidobacteriaceae bacterium]